jgi:hypothetical protein
MGAADDRVSELLDRWLASVELHARYLALDDASYAKVEDWPKHQRPTRWLVDIARARCEELKRQLAERRARRDETFADALELMAFLTNLMGSEHVERFIPLATGRPPKARAVATSPPAAAAPTAPAARAAAAESTAHKTARTPPTPPESASTTGTVEVAKPAAATRAPSRGKPAAGATGRYPRSAGTDRHVPQQTPTPRKPAGETAPPARSPAPPKGIATTKPAPPANDPTVSTVISDAARMLSWGREWPQLAGLIARLAGRPDEKQVWAILRQHRAAIEAKAAQQTG